MGKAWESSNLSTPPSHPIYWEVLYQGRVIGVVRHQFGYEAKREAQRRFPPQAEGLRVRPAEVLDGNEEKEDSPKAQTIQAWEKRAKDYNAQASWFEKLAKEAEQEAQAYRQKAQGYRQKETQALAVAKKTAEKEAPET